MKTTFTRVLLLIMTLCLLIPMLVACATDDPTPTPKPPQNNGGGEGGNDSDGENPAPPVVEDIYDVEDTLPESANYGSTFTILYWQQPDTQHHFWVAEDDGGRVNGAVYNAIALTEERFGVEIVANPSGTGSEQGHINQIKTEIQDGEPQFDMARMHDTLGANLSLDGMFMNLRGEGLNFNFEKPWWPKNTVEALTFMDQMYLISNSMSYTGLGGCNVVFFNKGLIEDLGKEEPYDKVLDKTWYLETLLKDVEDVWRDDGSFDEIKSSDDFYGIVIPSQMYSWFESFGIEMVKKNDDGTLTLNGQDERIYDLVDKIYRLCYEKNGGYMLLREKNDDPTLMTAKKMFATGMAVYIPTDLAYAEKIKTQYNSSVEYGIVPYPMLDESQTEYFAAHTDRYFAIPVNHPDKAYVSTIVESMSANGYRAVTPVYFNEILKDRYNPGETASKMLDIVNEHRVLDFSYAYGNDKWWSRALYHMMGSNKIEPNPEPNKDYASYYQKLFPEAEGRVDKIVTSFNDIKDKT